MAYFKSCQSLFSDKDLLGRKEATMPSMLRIFLADRFLLKKTRKACPTPPTSCLRAPGAAERSLLLSSQSGTHTKPSVLTFPEQQDSGRSGRQGKDKARSLGLLRGKTAVAEHSTLSRNRRKSGPPRLPKEKLAERQAPKLLHNCEPVSSSVEGTDRQ